jgi:hypothetical protein
MGFIYDIGTENKVSAAFYTKVVSVINGIVQPEAWSLVTTVEGLLWTSGTSVSLISDRLKQNIDGVLAVDYSSTLLNLKPGDKFTVGSTDYSIITVENIGEQNEVMQIPFKEYT